MAKEIEGSHTHFTFAQVDKKTILSMQMQIICRFCLYSSGVSLASRLIHADKEI